MADSKPAAYTAPALVTSTSDPVRANAKLISLLALGHFVVDLNQGSLPALLPFLKAAHQLSYAAVATIVLAANVASSIVQPLFGYFADRTARRWMLPASVLLTGGGFALMGLAAGFSAWPWASASPLIIPRRTRPPPAWRARRRRPRSPGSRWAATSASRSVRR